MGRPPNIVVCTADQLRPFALGCYGDGVARTPHLDRLAREGVRFEHAISNAPVCMAGRSVLVSGQHNRTCTGGVTNVSYQGPEGDFVMPDYPFPGRPHLPDPTLPEILRERGYHTATIGKWHIHSWPEDVGFDRYTIPRVHHCHSHQLFTDDGGPEYAPTGFSVDFEAERVAAFLREQSASARPFFLSYNISPPHCPLADAPERYLRLFDPASIPLRPNVDLAAERPREDYWFRVYRWDFRYYNLRLPYTLELPPGYDLRSLIAEYYGLTSWVDDAVGAMLGALDQTGLAEDTVVLFTADHGDCLGSNRLWQKGNPMEESIRVPFLLRWPAMRSLEPGQVPRAQVASLLDVAPTLLALAGGPAPAHLQGTDLSAVVLGREPATERPWAVAEMPRWTCVRTPSAMCSVSSGGGEAWPRAPEHLYDLDADPFELSDLAARAADVPRVRELLGVLERHDRETPRKAKGGPYT
jgi:arylsulfatase A-like enzyme